MCKYANNVSNNQGKIDLGTPKIMIANILYDSCIKQFEEDRDFGDRIAADFMKNEKIRYKESSICGKGCFAKVMSTVRSEVVKTINSKIEQHNIKFFSIASDKKYKKAKKLVFAIIDGVEYKSPIINVNEVGVVQEVDTILWVYLLLQRGRFLILLEMRRIQMGSLLCLLKNLWCPSMSLPWIHFRYLLLTLNLMREII